MSYIFISYSRHDHAYAHELAELLTLTHFNIWIDDNRIDYGQRWWDEIEKAIKGCTAFVVIMTENGWQSQWVKLEVHLARNLNKPIFPLLLDGENWSMLLDCHYVDVTDNQLPAADFFHALAQVVPQQKIGSKINPPFSETALQPETPPFDVMLAIDSFLAAHQAENWETALEWLVRIRNTNPNQVPRIFLMEINSYEKEIQEALSLQNITRQAQNDYEVLRRMLAHRQPSERIWHMLQNFWQFYPGYDPDNIADKVRPAPKVTPKELLLQMHDLELLPPERAVAGRDLAQLGDHRPGVGLNRRGLPDIDWVEIPEGEFIFGDTSEGNGPHVVNLPDFYLSRFPITYAQFEAFVHSGGYSNSAHWTPEGWEWKDDRANPDFGWNNPHWHLFNHPVIGINWYEADAFCRWLTTLTGCEIRLPTEQEWEKSARGTDGRLYPWGNDYTSGHANVNELIEGAGPFYLGRTSPVGIYTMGASPYGLVDMCGNVWEWCATSWDNPYQISQHHMAVVARGGSWNSTHYGARIVVRSRHERHYSGRNILGFRLCATRI